jgi:hypothetical protein
MGESGATLFHEAVCRLSTMKMLLTSIARAEGYVAPAIVRYSGWSLQGNDERRQQTDPKGSLLRGVPRATSNLLHTIG